MSVVGEEYWVHGGISESQGTILKTKRKSNVNPITIGYDENNVPAQLYFDNGYINRRLELSINAKTWKVYFYGVVIGKVNDDGRIELNEESNQR